MAEADGKGDNADKSGDAAARAQGALADDGALTGAVNDEARGGDQTASAARSTRQGATDESKGKAADVDLPGVTASGAE